MDLISFLFILVVQFMTLVKENPFSLKLGKGWNLTNVIFINIYGTKKIL